MHITAIVYLGKRDFDALERGYVFNQNYWGGHEKTKTEIQFQWKNSGNSITVLPLFYLVPALLNASYSISDLFYKRSRLSCDCKLLIGRYAQQCNLASIC